MNKIYPDCDEKLVKSVILHADADDGNVFYDEENTAGVTKDELFNLFSKNLAVIKLDEEYLMPVAYAVESGAGKVTCVKDSGSAATMLNFYSKEHVGG